MKDLLPTAAEAVRRARKIVREQLPGTVTVKSERNTATEVDYAVERTVREVLLTESPEIGFLGEEDGRFGDGDSEWMWADIILRRNGITGSCAGTRLERARPE